MWKTLVETVRRWTSAPAVRPAPVSETPVENPSTDSGGPYVPDGSYTLANFTLVVEDGYGELHADIAGGEYHGGKFRSPVLGTVVRMIPRTMSSDPVVVTDAA